MRCPNCQRENQASNQFCIFCGARMVPPHTQSSTPQAAVNADELRQLRQSIIDIASQLDTVRRNLEQATTRLAALEGTAPAAAAQTTLPPEPVVPFVREVEPVPAAPVAFAQPEVLGQGAVREPAMAVPIPAVAPARPEPRPKRAPGEWEQMLGGNWLARIGVLALLIGIGFFLKYAFDRNWVGPAMRAVIALAVGFIMIGAGYMWRKKYPIMTQVLSGGGVGVLYLSVFAAFAAYAMIPFLLAVALVLVICAGSVFFALRYNSMALAILGLLGAYIAPLMLGVKGGTLATSGLTSAWEIPAYLTIVNIGVLVVSTFRNWRWFTLMALLFSLAIFAAWYGGKDILAGELTLAVTFIIFTAATIMFHVIRRVPAAGYDYALMSVNAALFFIVSQAVMWSDLKAWMGGFTLLLALFYGLLYYYIRRTGPEGKRLALFTLGIALVLLTIAVPMQFGNQAWGTVGWAAQGAVLVWLSLRLPMGYLRPFAYGAFGLTALRLMFWDTFVGSSVYSPVLNARSLAFAIGIAALYISGFMLWRKRDNLSEKEKSAGGVFPAFSIAANVLMMWWVGAEVIIYAAGRATAIEGRPLALLLIPAAMTAAMPFVWRRALRTYDLVLIILNAVLYVIMSFLVWGDYRTWMGSLYLALTLIYFGAAWGLALRRDEDRRPVAFAACTGVTLLTAAIAIQFGGAPWTPVAWSVEVAALLWAAGAARLPVLRFFAYAVFVVTAGRLLIFDTAVKAAGYQPITNTRVLAYALGILSAYGAFFLLRRDKEKLPEWKTPASTFLVIGNVLTLWLLSFELWSYLDTFQASVLKSAGLRSVQNLSLTALWLVYAIALLVVGISRRSRAWRWGALVLIAASVLKVFIYDVFALQTIYRVIAFTGLGVLLLVGGYLYQRYTQRIKEFLTGN